MARKKGTLAQRHGLLKVESDWWKDPRDNDLKPDWLKMSRSTNNESEHEYETRTTPEKKLLANVENARESNLLRAEECKT